MAARPISPSKDPAGCGSLPGVFAAVFRKQIESIDGQLPAMVISYDRVSNTAKVVPMVQRVATNGEVFDRETVARVPVLALGGGGYGITFPLQAGDKGWIEASDRDISLFMQLGQKKSKPNTLRVHNFSSGRFVPDMFGKLLIAGEDSGAVVLQITDGSMRIAIDSSQIRLRAGSTSIILNKNGDITQSTAGKINLNGELWLNGNKYLLHSHGDPQGGNVGPVIP